MNDLVSLEEAAQQAGVPSSTLRRWLSMDHIETYSSGRDRRRRFIRQRDLDRLLEPRPVSHRRRPSHDQVLVTR